MNKLFTDSFVKWIETPDNQEPSIVISSRIRLARNLREWPFPHLLEQQQGSDFISALKQTAAQPDIAPQLDFLEVAQLTDLNRKVLLEKNLLSPEFVKHPCPWQAIWLSQDGSLSVMVNEEDHFRMQSLLPGENLNKCWQMVSQLDDSLEQYLNYAFDDRKGYLTACPTNVGTGMRASVMLHLPAIQMSGQAAQLVQSIGQLGITVRGLYGEGTKAIGNLFQISNQVTLGQTENDICNYLKSLTHELIEQENRLRENFLKQRPDQLRDKVQRAYGLLSQSHIMDIVEALTLLSDIRLGIDLGFVNNLTPSQVNQIMITISPAHLQQSAGGNLSLAELDKLRAHTLRGNMKFAGITPA